MRYRGFSGTHIRIFYSTDRLLSTPILSWNPFDLQEDPPFGDSTLPSHTSPSFSLLPMTHVLISNLALSISFTFLTDDNSGSNEFDVGRSEALWHELRDLLDSNLLCIDLQNCASYCSGEHLFKKMK